jgi:hypothetical protein
VSGFLKPIHAVAVTWTWAILSVPVSANAGKVVCPVCGEELPDDVEECPNDGTNLRLLEKYKKKKEPQKAPDRSDKVTETERSTESHDGEPAPQEPEPAGPLLFKRHDQGGDRQPAANRESSGYSDRMSRIPADRRHMETVKRLPFSPQKGAHAESDEVDQQLKSEFESRREEKWRERGDPSHRQPWAQKGEVSKRRLLLSNLAAPITSVGARLFWMPEGPHAGPVGAAEIDANLARYRLRAGLSSLIGVRALKTRSELVFIESVSIGFQWPRRYSPFIIARGGIGLTAGERFKESQIYMMTALGAEVGMDTWLNPWIAISPSLGYMRCIVNNAYWHSFTAKLSVGF